MKFIETALKGAFIIDLEHREDNRGFFARTFCQKEFETHGLKPFIAQANIAFNRLKGTLRGMHFQCPPAPAAKAEAPTSSSKAPRESVRVRFMADLLSGAPRGPWRCLDREPA